LGFNGKAVVVGVLTSLVLYLPALLGVPFIGLFALFAGGLTTGYLSQKTEQSGAVGGLTTGILSGVLIGIVLGVFVGFTWTETVLEATPVGEDPEAFLRFFKTLAIVMGVTMGIIAGIILGTTGGILGKALNEKKKKVDQQTITIRRQIV